MAASSSAKPEAQELQGLFPKNHEALTKMGGIGGVISKLKTNPERGLTADEAKTGFTERISRFGENKLPEPPMKSLMSLVIDGLQDKTLIMLIISAVVSLVLGVLEDPKSGWIEGTAILCAVVVVVMVSSLNDYQKERQFRALNQKKNNKPVKVIRDGNLEQVSVYSVMVGDVVDIATGDILCADGLFLSGFNMKCDESTMTGESDAMKKSEAEPFLLSSCQVIEGVGRMLVCAIGPHSVAGSTMLLLQKPAEDTPLQLKLEHLADQIAKFGLTAAVLILISLTVKLGVKIYLGHEPFVMEHVVSQMLKYVISSITIVVVAVPEGLPLAVTIALAYSMKKMLKDNNLVRHLEACETMGGATTICSDKTGTLTTNRMTVMKAYFAGARFETVDEFTAKRPSSAFWNFLHTGNVVNSTANKSKNDRGVTEWVGSKTECALMGFTEKCGEDYQKIRTANPVINLIPFSSARKRMSTLIKHSQDRYALYCKGASEIVFGMCTYIMDANADIRPLDDGDRAAVKATIENFASQSLRTIGLAVRLTPAVPAVLDEEEKEMVFMGLVGIMDPVRDEVPRAVQICQGAGIVVRMVTGDNVVTARAIAKDCGILKADSKPDEEVVIEGPVFREMSEEARDALAPKIRVMARSSPTDKYTLIQALKKNGHVVAVTGDGTNDAPALKEAHVGFAMGITGTEVAKEASDIILMDDNFNSIVKACSWGRNVYDSIRKFLQFQMTVNFVAVLLAFIGALTSSHGEAPLKPVQLLWVNLIMDTMAALALATDEPTPELLKRSPYGKNDSIITRRMLLSIAGQAIFQLTVNLAVLYYGHVIFGVEKDSVTHLTVVFNMFVLCQLFNEVNSRKLYGELNVFSGFFSNTIFLSVFVFTLLMQWLIIQFGGEFASTTPLSLDHWILCLGLSSLSLPLAFLLKLIPVKEPVAPAVVPVAAPKPLSAAGSAGWARVRAQGARIEAVAKLREISLAGSLRRVHRIAQPGFGLRTQVSAPIMSVLGGGAKKDN
jgi:Ca2+-transporting ATPase